MSHAVDADRGLNSKLCVGIALALAAALPLQSQTGLPTRPILKAEAVEYLSPERLTVASGRPSTVALHFRIEQGLHINSHTPRESYLIPTTLIIPEGSGVRLDNTTYPPGTDFTLAVDPATKLSVYTGEFTIQARMVVTPGEHPVEAKLRFQACDRNECMPPKTIPVAIDVIGK